MQKHLKYFISKMIPRFIIEEAEYDPSVSNNKLSLPLFIEHFFEFLGNSYWRDKSDPSNFYRYLDSQTNHVWRVNTETSERENLGEVGDNITLDNASVVLPDPTSGILYTLNPDYIIDNLISISDIDQTIDDYVIYFKKKYALTYPHLGALSDFGEGASTEIRRLIKKIHEFYVSKGTEDSFKFFFRSIYNKEITLYYPKVDLFKSSDGKWNEPYYLSLEKHVTNPDDSNEEEWVAFNELASWQNQGDKSLFPPNEIQNYLDYQIIGKTSKAYSWIKSIEQQPLPIAVLNEKIQYWVNVAERYGKYTEGEIVSLFPKDVNPFVDDTFTIDFSKATREYRIRNRGYVNVDGVKNPDLDSSYPDPTTHEFNYKGAYSNGVLYKIGDVVYNATDFSTGTNLSSGFYVCGVEHYSISYPEFKLGKKYHRTSVVFDGTDYYSVKNGKVDYNSELYPEYDTNNFVFSGYATESETNTITQWQESILVSEFETVYRIGLRTDDEPKDSSRYVLVTPDGHANNDYIPVGGLDNPLLGISLFKNILVKNKWDDKRYFYDYIPVTDTQLTSIMSNVNLTALLADLITVKSNPVSLSDYTDQELGMLNYLMSVCVYKENDSSGSYLAWRKKDVSTPLTSESLEYKLFTRSSVIDPDQRTTLMSQYTSALDDARPDQIGPNSIDIVVDPAYDFRDYFSLSHISENTFPTLYWELTDDAAEGVYSFDPQQKYQSASIVRSNGNLWIVKSKLEKYQNVVYPGNDDNWVYLRISDEVADASIETWDPTKYYNGGDYVRTSSTYNGTDSGKGDIYVLRTYKKETFNSIEFPENDPFNWELYAEDYDFQNDYDLGSISDPRWILLPSSIHPEELGVAENIFKKDWLDFNSFASWNKIIQDSNYWQDFSYEITTDLDRAAYEKSLLEVLHPQGLKFFNKIASVEQTIMNADLHLGGWLLKNVTSKTYFPVYPFDSYDYFNQYITYDSNGDGVGTPYLAKDPRNNDDAAIRDLPELDPTNEWKKWWMKLDDGLRIVIKKNIYSVDGSIDPDNESKDQYSSNIQKESAFFSFGNDWTWAEKTPEALNGQGIMDLTFDDFRRNVGRNNSLAFVNGLKLTSTKARDYNFVTPSSNEYDLEGNTVTTESNLQINDNFQILFLHENNVAVDGFYSEGMLNYYLDGDIKEEFVANGKSNRLFVFRDGKKEVPGIDYILQTDLIHPLKSGNAFYEIFMIPEESFVWNRYIRSITIPAGAPYFFVVPGGYLVMNDLLLFKNGLLLTPYIDYSVKGISDLVFTSDVESSDKIEIYSIDSIYRDVRKMNHITNRINLSSHIEHNLFKQIYSERIL